MNQELIEAKAASLENVTSDHRWGFIQGAHWANEQASERFKQLEEQAYDLLGRLQAANLKIAVLEQIAKIKEKNT